MGTVAITGASGYIGKHLLAELIRLDEGRVKILTRRQAELASSLQVGVGVESVPGNLHEPATLLGFLEPGCTVVHLAYLYAAGEAENLAATRNLLAACQAAKVGRLIHCSTAAVVGREREDVIDENSPCKPVSGYGIEKLKIEQEVARAAGGVFDVVILRPTSVFGPEGESLKKLAADLMTGNRLRNYLKSCLFNKRSMNLVHVSNVVASIVFAIRRQASFNGGVYIVSEDDDPRNNFADTERFLIDQLGVSSYVLPPVPIPLGVLSLLLSILGRNNPNPRCRYQPGKLLEAGFERPLTFGAGLKDYTDWYRSKSQGEGRQR